MILRLTTGRDALIRLAVMSGVCLLLRVFVGLAETNDVEKAMITDSDGDGVTDWNEWQAGTNPGDPTNCFGISNITIENDSAVLTWKSVGTSTYEVVFSTAITGLTTNPQHSAFIPAIGGTAPWYETLSSATNSLTGGNMFFRVQRVLPQDFEQSTLDMATFE